MRSNTGVDEIPLTYSKPSVIKETRAHFDSLLRKAADQEVDSNTMKVSNESPTYVLSPRRILSLGNELQLQQARRKRKKNHKSSKHLLLDPDDDLSYTDEDIITSNDEIYTQEKISDDVIVHCNPGFTSDSDSKESSNKQEKEEQTKKVYNSMKKKLLESNTVENDSSSSDSVPSLSSLNKQNENVQMIQSFKSPVKEHKKSWSAVSDERKSESNDYENNDENSKPIPPPRSKKIVGKMSLTQRLSKLSPHFSHSTLSSHVSSEDSIQTAVHVSPMNDQVDYQISPQDNKSNSQKQRHIQIVGSQQDSGRENIELKPLTGWTPSYEEIDESTLSSRTADLPVSRSRAEKNIVQKKRSDNSIQSYDETDVDSQNEAVSKDRVQRSARRKSTSKQKQGPSHRATVEETVSAVKFKRRRNRSQQRRLENQVSDSDEDERDDEVQNAHYNYDQVLGITIHHCDRLQVNSLIIHPVVRVHVIDVTTGKYLKKSDENRCYSYEEPSNIDFIQPISTQPCNFTSLRSLTPMWEEMLVVNEDIQYVTADGMNVIILFEINDFVSFEMASVQYKKLGTQGGWHRIAWAFLKLIASNGSSNLNKRLRLQLFKPAPEKRAKAPNEALKCDVYQHWLKGSRKRYPATIHVTVQGVKPSSDLPLPHLTLHPDPGSIDVLPPSLALPTDQDHDSATETVDQKSVKDDQTNVKTPEVISWSRITGHTCKIPNEKSVTLLAGNLGCFCLRFSPCGKFLAADSANHNSHSLLVYGIPGGSLIKRFHGHQGLIYDLQWSAGSKFISSASADCTACVWDVETALVKMLPHPSFVYCASFLPEDDEALHLVTGCCDHILRVWTRSDKHEDFQLAHELMGHEGFITSICYDGAGKFYSGDSEGKIRIWTHDESDLSLMKEVKLRELSGVAISRLVPHPGRQRLLIHARDSTLRMINIATGSPLQWFTGAVNHRLQTGATLSPCGRLVLSASEDGTFWVWNADTGKPLATYSDIIHRTTSQRSVLPLSGTVDYHPYEHMAAFSVYGKHAPIVLCVYAKNASGKSIGLQLMSANAKENSVLLSNDAIFDWMKNRSKKPEAGDSKDSYLSRQDPPRNSSRTTKSSHSYEGSLASIIQQMDEVIALTRRSNHSSDGPIKKLSPAGKTQESNNFPQLTRVSEKDSSRSSSISIRRNPQDVVNEQQKIKRRHFSLDGNGEPNDVVLVETAQTGRKSSEVAPVVSTTATVEYSVGTSTRNAEDRIKSRPSSTESTPNKIKNLNQHVLSVSSVNSDSDSHIVDLTEVLP